MRASMAPLNLMVVDCWNAHTVCICRASAHSYTNKRTNERTHEPTDRERDSHFGTRWRSFWRELCLLASFQIVSLFQLESGFGKRLPPLRLGVSVKQTRSWGCWEVSSREGSDVFKQHTCELLIRILFYLDQKNEHRWTSTRSRFCSRSRSIQFCFHHLSRLCRFTQKHAARLCLFLPLCSSVRLVVSVKQKSLWRACYVVR